MEEYKSLLRERLAKAQEQVARNNDYAKRAGSRHESHNDYAEGVRDGLQAAYDLLPKQPELKHDH